MKSKRGAPFSGQQGHPEKGAENAEQRDIPAGFGLPGHRSAFDKGGNHAVEMPVGTPFTETVDPSFSGRPLVFTAAIHRFFLTHFYGYPPKAPPSSGVRRRKERRKRSRFRARIE
ncbi:hypothetical protein [Pontiella sp.]|uniref:hypothetical protein n=1 Tax=Pontiella sp. TaxID=2837462 RepID=UPI00356ABACE